MIEDPTSKEYSSETTEEDLPQLQALSLDFPIEEVKRPKYLFSFEGRWEGLDPETPITPGEYEDPGVVDRVNLPEVSTRIESIPEAFHETVEPETKLSQEGVFDVMETIDIEKLTDSVVGGKKAGFTLTELNTFAKQLGIPVTGLKKIGMAQRILDKIKLKTEETT